MAYHRGPKIVTDGLIGYWDSANKKSYPGSGDLFYDLSGNNNNGTLFNSVSFNTGNLGSLNFDGNDYVTIPDSSLWNFTDFTIDIWLNRSIIWTSASLSDAILGQSEGVGNTNKWALTYQSSSNKVLFYSNPNVGNVTSSYSLQIITGSWYNWVITKNSSTYNFYANGGFLGSSVNTGSLTDVNSLLRVGWVEDSQQYFSGSISNIKLYNKALSEAEIFQNYSSFSTRFSSIPIPPPALDYFIVAGGGAGGTGGVSNAGNGGGGAGGFLSGSVTVVSQSYLITIGGGGSATPTQTSGSNSIAFGLTAIGGGRGGSSTAGASSGGSGGGADGNQGGGIGSGTAGPPRQGYNGGSGGGGGGGNQGAGGGGGASAVGGNNSGSTSGNGGAGTLSSINGSPIHYAGGGGGGQSDNGSGGSGGVGSGGVGGGGRGGIWNGGDGFGVSGTANTGGGGGGMATGRRVTAAGGSGGSGVIIIKYSNKYKPATVTGNPETTFVSGSIIYTFRGTGTISW